MEILMLIIGLLAGTGLGYALGRHLLAKLFKKQEQEATDKANLIIKEAEIKAENLKNKQIIEAKEKILELRTEAEQDINTRKNILAQNDQRVKIREQKVQKQLEQIARQEAEIESLKTNLEAQIDAVRMKKEDLEKIHKEEIVRLEKLSGLNRQEAREQIIESLKRETETKAAAQVRIILEEAKLTAAKEARRIVLNTIQRTATEHAIENCVSVFNIENEEIKGKIIGREGRNIRTLESVTGVEIIIDDTPDAIIISGFDPIRREIARLSLHRLVSDGRIHPARIEEVVNKTRIDIESEIMEIGERTAIDLGVHGLAPELVKMVGRMRFRSSYGQNLLQHSREVAKLCALMATEMGLNAKLAKRAGLLHDIGKVYTEDPETPHALIGFELAKKYKEHPEVCNAIGAHHDEMEMTSLISPIVQACDAISGARPGARREVMESYVQRIKEMEKLAVEFQGVNSCYALQAGRELRIVVDAENVNDERAQELCFQISEKIENTMQYPGQIKVTVIRETRAVSYAK